MDFRSDIDAVRVPSASDKTPPATGTAEPSINLAVRMERLSAWAFTTVCMLKTPKKTVVISDKIHKANFFTACEIPPPFINGETLAARLRLKYQPMKGTTAKFEKRLTPFAAPKSSVLIETLVTAFPVAAVIAANIGINAVIKVAQAFIAPIVVFIDAKIGVIIAPAIEIVAV